MSAWSFSKHVRKTGKLDQLKKQQDLRPVTIDGGVIARTWWGKAWNRNLESYPEYASLIGRGRSTVGSGAILDLQVNAGEATALVQGSRTKPYQVTIRIQKLNKNTWNQVTSACEGKLGSREELLAGRIPQNVEEAFIRPRMGLFPSPKEIEFACTCPDRRQARRRPDVLFYASRCRYGRPDQRTRIEQEADVSSKGFTKEFPDGRHRSSLRCSRCRS